ncbi:dihydroorotase [Komagataella kurtzmanii]|nr:dihydroorotase [Komagataella kurtzmanii]
MKLSLGITADLHVHLRQNKMMELITPTVRQGGVSVVYVMPNLTPPITSIAQVVEYKAQLQKLSPKTTFLMSFYLNQDLTPQLVEQAAQEKLIRGIKCYPAGVTTNSKLGVDPNDFSKFYPIFTVMEKHNLILNLHGEKPSVQSEQNEEDDIHVLNAESKFIPALFKLHKDFPNLKIVLEHCTTKDAIEAVQKINENTTGTPTVAASITAHHLSLTIDSWAGNPINFCKPVAKLPRDKKALIDAATSGKPYFFFGSDSAPHSIHDKSKHIGVCAGVFTQPYVLSYVAEVFEQRNALDKLKDFVGIFGLSFYGITDDELISKDTVSLVKKDLPIPELIGEKDLQVAPFKPGETLHWEAIWDN